MDKIFNKNNDFAGYLVYIHRCVYTLLYRVNIHLFSYTRFDLNILYEFIL